MSDQSHHEGAPHAKRKNDGRPLLRHFERCLLRRAQDSESPAENGQGRPGPDLKAAFEKHRDETEAHVERLQQVFEIFGKRAQAKTCPAIDGIIEEGEGILDEYKGTAALDAGLLAAAQAVEHYEMSRYGTLKAWALKLGMRDAAKLLDATLKQETKTDASLTVLAEGAVNMAAAA